MRLAFRGVAEVWSDDAIAAVYRPGAVMFGAGIVVPIWGPVFLELEAAYRKLQPKGTEGDETNTDPRRFHIVPITVLAEYRLDPLKLPIQAFVAAGPTFTVWTEQFAPGSVDFDDATVDWSQVAAQSGAKVGAELRLGLRFPIDVINPRPEWQSKGGLQAVEIELFGAKRFNKTPKPGEGLNLNAWRAGLGLLLGF